MSKARKKPTKEIAALLALRERDIDLSDQDEVNDWSDGIVGKFYRPIKKPATARFIGRVKVEGRHWRRQSYLVAARSRLCVRVSNPAGKPIFTTALQEDLQALRMVQVKGA